MRLNLGGEPGAAIDRVIAAVDSGKARGVKLGNAALAVRNHDRAAERAEALRPIFAELAGLSAHKAADALNARSVETLTDMVRQDGASCAGAVRLKTGLCPLVCQRMRGCHVVSNVPILL